MKTAIISRNPDIMGGQAVFPGTRVLIATLVDYLEARMSETSIGARALVA